MAKTTSSALESIRSSVIKLCISVIVGEDACGSRTRAWYFGEDACRMMRLCTLAGGRIMNTIQPGRCFGHMFPPRSNLGMIGVNMLIRLITAMPGFSSCRGGRYAVTGFHRMFVTNGEQYDTWAHAVLDIRVRLQNLGALVAAPCNSPSMIIQYLFLIGEISN